MTSFLESKERLMNTRTRVNKRLGWPTLRATTITSQPKEITMDEQEYVERIEQELRGLRQHLKELNKDFVNNCDQIDRLEERIDDLEDKLANI